MSNITICLMLVGTLIPSLTVTGPPRKRSEVLAISNLRSLLGKNHFAKDAFEFRDQFKSMPTLIYIGNGSEARGFFVSWRDYGIDAAFDENCQFSGFFFNANHTAGSFTYKEYRGELPEGFTFKNTVADVRKKLGNPDDVSGGDGISEVHWSYNKKGLSFRFNTKVPKDDATIYCISMGIEPKE